MTAEAAAAIPAAESLIEVLIESASSLDETYLYKGDSASIRLVPSLSLATECCRYCVCLCDCAHGRLARPKTEEGKKGKLSVIKREARIGAYAPKYNFDVRCGSFSLQSWYL
ncbi:unnamed protein product [Polarella glacialis]|uniref:Uncharacterized protein n=1 Tax=Polarella glacialis TaxID=89957 RepID=A0A813FBA0_POLGL|nr:unnamed protein product [Polarella glacialis]